MFERVVSIEMEARGIRVIKDIILYNGNTKDKAPSGALVVSTSQGVLTTGAILR